MKINEAKLNFNGLISRQKTEYLILHHSGGTSPCSVEAIHTMHKANGWAGIGYHYYVRKDGEVWRGRAQWAVGSHCPGKNANSIGICFEGNFEVEQMGEAQLAAGLELVHYLRKQVYPGIIIGGHGQYYATACPGKNCPMDRFQHPGGAA
jgi:N-acetyl-anhydromuramyl-L-alanine amidase AmpD